jgi:hypothetical protein
MKNFLTAQQYDFYYIQDVAKYIYSTKFQTKCTANNYIQRESPAKSIWLKMVSIGRSLLKREVPIFSADFIYSLSRDRPFKFLPHFKLNLRYEMNF